jgi:hypothetical protein
MRLLSILAVSYAAGEKLDVVTNRPLLALMGCCRFHRHFVKV